MTNVITSLKESFANITSTLRRAKTLNRVQPCKESATLVSEILVSVENLEEKILDVMLSTDAYMTPRNWKEACEVNDSLMSFDAEFTQLLTAPSEEHLDNEVGLGQRSMGTVEAVVDGVTYMFSTILIFDTVEPSAFYYHTVVKVNGESLNDFEEQDANYQNAANYGKFLIDIICKEDDDSDDPSQG